MMDDLSERKITITKQQKEDESIGYELVGGILITFYSDAAHASFWYRGHKYSSLYPDGTDYTEILSNAKQWVKGCDRYMKDESLKVYSDE